MYMILNVDVDVNYINISIDAFLEGNKMQSLMGY